jgi:hypothetical protein
LESFVTDVLSERYVGIGDYADFHVARLSQDSSFFQCGPGMLCYGRPVAGFLSRSGLARPPDGLSSVRCDDGCVELPFDPVEVIENLRRERYLRAGRGSSSFLKKVLADLYYLARPVLPVGVRKHIQRLHASGWKKIAFPAWPVDTTVENAFEILMAIALQTSGVQRIPFIWFWPEGFSSCAMLTHDVETTAGKLFCSRLMDINDGYGIKSSFQVVPEERYEVSHAFLNSIRNRGFEVNIHDFNHDGRLFRSQAIFRQRVGKINGYARAFEAAGFRSAVMYRNQDWLHELSVEYDMSVPNVAHLDPQRGGCCTVFPYFLGNLIELPLTTTQDYMLFQLLDDYSIDLWNKQIELVLAKHGLLSFLVHPDYIIEERAQKTYRCLLARLAQIRSRQNVWIALPKQIAEWWRQRSQMKLVRQNRVWEVVGAGKDRARIAYAKLQNDRVVYTIGTTADDEVALAA